MQASITSPRLWGGMLVAMPTAMPPEPLTSRLGNLDGSTDGSLQRAVVVLPELDRILVEVVEHGAGDLGEPAFGVAVGRRRIVVDGAEVALAVDQREAHGEVLRHAHQRVVDRQVAVRVILAHHLADHARALDVLLVVVEAQLVHAEQDAPVHGLQAVAHVGQRARHDHAHGVIEIGALHLVGDGDGPDVASGPCRRARRRPRVLSLSATGCAYGCMSVREGSSASGSEPGKAMSEHSVWDAAEPLIAQGFGEGKSHASQLDGN